MTSKVVRTADRITYSESVKINIGDYESREVQLFYGTDFEEGEDFDGALKRARSRVRKALTISEKRIRVASQSNVDFDTKSKLMREGY